MTINKTEDYLISLLHELCKLPQETEWVEFKENNKQPELIGEYISALANVAAYYGKANAYLIWGVDDITHNIVGTTFQPQTQKIGNQELESWLLQHLAPKVNFQFYPITIDDKQVILLEIGAAFRHPVQFKHIEFIRVGTYKKKLKDFPEKERELWRIFDQKPFESLICTEKVDGANVLELLDYTSYFSLLKLPLPDGHKAILEALLSDNLIERCEAGGFNITNLGAILFAKSLNDFPALKRKAIRVVRYQGIGRIETIKEQLGTKGYASGFEGLIEYVMALLPSNEIIAKALRKDVPMYPDLAVREIVANAIIHQDFFSTGTSPMVEIFDNRMEITNPGQPLIDTNRFLDSPPQSRNESLASMMRRFGVCEERGSGIDKVVFQTEFYQLPAPLFQSPAEFTRVVLFSHQKFDEMSKEDRIRATYLHCCLQYVNHQKMTNKSLRDRFGLDSSKGSSITRTIKWTAAEGLIVNTSDSESRRDTSYAPFWSISDKNNS